MTTGKHSFVFLGLLAILFTVTISGPTDKCVRLTFLPMPKNITCVQANNQVHTLADPCKILYHVKNENQKDNDLGHFKELIEDQQAKTFNCKITNLIFGSLDGVKLEGFDYTLSIEVKDPTLKSAFNTSEEAYTLDIDKGEAKLVAPFYVGMVHGLETFLQSFECPRYRYKNCTQRLLPIHIEDEPAFPYRGLMVDTSRHFLPIHLLYQTIDAMMYNKMSIFHWHITDEDSFPLLLDAHPEIAQHAAFSEEEVYTTSQARDIVRYAMVRGIRVVPELDSPGHAASWGKAPENKKLACTFGAGYMGPLDVTLDETYKLVREVFAEIMDIFPDPIIHLGGDEVVLTCLTNKTEFVEKEGIKAQQIERHYRRKQHKIIKELNSSKQPMYWMNSKIDVEEGDIVHWWGGGNPKTTNPVVISNYGPFYLDMGVGNYFGNNYGSYITWLDLYNKNIGKMIENYDNKKNVIGAEVALWSEINNRYTHHMKIWMRSSSFAERVWNTGNFNPKPDFFGRITAHERIMNRRGIPTAPVTCQQCETNPQFC